jgi:hypothetical protein
MNGYVIKIRSYLITLQEKRAFTTGSTCRAQVTARQRAMSTQRLPRNPPYRSSISQLTDPTESAPAAGRIIINI